MAAGPALFMRRGAQMKLLLTQRALRAASRGKVIFLLIFLQKSEKCIRGTVQYQFLRESHFPDKGQGIGEIPNIGAAVAVAGKKYRVAVFLAKR